MSMSVVHFYTSLLLTSCHVIQVINASEVARHVSRENVMVIGCPLFPHLGGLAMVIKPMRAWLPELRFPSTCICYANGRPHH